MDQSGILKNIPFGHCCSEIYFNWKIQQMFRFSLRINIYCAHDAGFISQKKLIDSFLKVYYTDSPSLQNKQLEKLKQMMGQQQLSLPNYIWQAGNWHKVISSNIKAHQCNSSVLFLVYSVLSTMHSGLSARYTCLGIWERAKSAKASMSTTCKVQWLHTVVFANCGVPAWK